MVNLYKNICSAWVSRNFAELFFLQIQFVIFKLLSYCFQETTEFDVKVSFASRPVSRLIRWYNKPVGMTKKFWEKAIQFHGTFPEFKITNWIDVICIVKIQ